MLSALTIARPRVFISSTVRDFADLRDALKYWLEEMGFEVQLSEHTDFDRRPEAGAFQACFEAIRANDYYVLLVGHRRGMWYDESNRLSVTRQEYRTALESFDSIEKPRIIAAVRSDVVVALKERERLGATEGDSLLEDPQFTAEFIREVRGDDAVAEGAQEPNWLAPFRDFRELIAILRITLGIRGPLPRVAVLEGLRRELQNNLRLMLRNHRNRPSYNHFWLNTVRREVILGEGDLGQFDGSVELTYEQMKNVIAYLIGGLQPPEQFVQIALNDCITSGALLDYDNSQNAFRPSPLLEALYQLRQELHLYERRMGFVKEQQPTLFAAWASARLNHGSADIPAMALFALYSVHDNQYNITRLLLGVLRYLYGHTPAIEINLRPTSPIERFDEEIRREAVTEEQLETWLREDHLLLQVGMADQTEEQRRELENLERRFRETFGDEADQILQRDLNELLGLDESDEPK